MSLDFWDIDDILRGEESINCRFQTIGVGLGHLDALRAASGAKDLPKNSVLSLPVWLMVPLARGGSIEPILPDSYKQSMQNVLRKGAEGGRFRDKSVNYFQVGLILSWLTSNKELASALFLGVLQRISFIIDQSAHAHRTEETDFMFMLTNFEQAIYLSGVCANEEFDLWRHGKLHEIKSLLDI